MRRLLCTYAIITGLILVVLIALQPKLTLGWNLSGWVALIVFALIMSLFEEG